MDRVTDFLRKPVINPDKNNSFSKEERLAESLPQGIFVLNKARCVQWWNRVANDLLALEAFGYGADIQNIIPSTEFCDFLGEDKTDTIELISPVHRGRHLSIHRCSYENEQTLMIVRDVTHTHHLETMRKDFIANVSHELRTPLTVFHGYLEILQDLEAIDKGKLNVILAQMSEQSERMECLVKDLLLLSRLESAEPDVENHQQVDVVALIEMIVEDAKALSGSQGHCFNLSLDKKLTLYGQPSELRSAFSNIIFNAVRYTPEKGDIHIRWHADKFGAKFQVKDSGIGISAKHLSRVTQRFYRVDKARSREAGGTGLGLAIVKHVLLRHGGELSIESVPNQGSCFSCSFPSK